MTPLREHKHALNIIYIPAVTIAGICVEAFALPSFLAAMGVLFVVGIAMVVLG